MDIVSRLKKYMDYRQIAISQFADTCNIPRPTISQILNGRNKKISDELIGKIHFAFQDLSVLWLMFGEGEMLINSNIKTSEASTDQKLSFEDSQTIEHDMFVPEEKLFPEITDIYSNKNDTVKPLHDINSVTENEANLRHSPNLTDILSGKEESTKKITSIVVFYADNTFQTFRPS